MFTQLGQKLPTIYRTEISYRVQENPSLDLALILLNSGHAQVQFLNIHFDIALGCTLRFPCRPFPTGFPAGILYTLPFFGMHHHCMASVLC